MDLEMPRFDAAPCICKSIPFGLVKTAKGEATISQCIEIRLISKGRSYSQTPNDIPFHISAI
jgi:hypothetical protein